MHFEYDLNFILAFDGFLHCKLNLTSNSDYQALISKYGEIFPFYYNYSAPEKEPFAMYGMYFVL